MSFRISAAGSTTRSHVFSYSRAGLDIGDIYDGIGALGAIAGSPITSRAGLAGLGAATAEVAGDQVVDAISGNAHQRAVTAMGRMHGVSLMAMSFTMLCTHEPLVLFVSVHGDWSVFGSPSGSLEMEFDCHMTSPVSDLLNRLTPILERCDLNGFGVLAGLGQVFEAYDGVAGRGADRWYRLNIDITAT
jgi:hypothetical protein